MKIALFTDTYDEINGVGNTYRHLTADCARRGRQLDVYCYTMGRDTIETRGTVRILRYRPSVPVPIYSDLIFDLAVVRREIWDEFTRAGYDLVHTATPGSIGLVALALARRFDLPMIGAYHTSLGEYVHARAAKLMRRCRLPADAVARTCENTTWAFMRWYYDHCKMVLAPSQYSRNLLETRFGTKIDVFSRGIDTEAFDPAFRAEPPAVTVLYVGRVSIEKNLDVLADIFKDKKDARLVIVGDGPYLKEMRRLCPNAAFTGFLSGEPLSRAYAGADLFAFPSTTDTFGNVVREAMSSGVPAVVTDKMGPKEQVEEGVTGFVARDRADFAAKLQRLIDDADLRRTMGRNARQYALSKNWDAVFDRLFEQYAEVLAMGRGFR